MDPSFSETPQPNETSSSLTGRAKKRKWFQDRYKTEDNKSRTVKQKIGCKFFGSTGRCRNGNECPFEHSQELQYSYTRHIIQEPCKFLYVATQGCSKGNTCHFSHDVGQFKCPTMFGKHHGRCEGRGCQFDHSDFLTESDVMDFARIYKQYILGLGREAHPRWDFYLRDKDESEILKERTRKHSGNLFNVPIGRIFPVSL